MYDITKAENHNTTKKQSFNGCQTLNISQHTHGIPKKIPHDFHVRFLLANSMH